VFFKSDGTLPIERKKTGKVVLGQHAATDQTDSDFPNTNNKNIVLNISTANIKFVPIP
jgi:hypothetical protein